MGKNKADWQAEAKAAGVDFKPETTVKQLQAAIKKASHPGHKAAAKKLSEPEQTLKDRAARRERDAKEAAIAAENRAKNQAEADAKVRTAAQQAVDRSESE